MEMKYNIEIETKAVEANLKKLINQTYKLLPNREEGIDWQTPLTTIMEELAGMDRLLFGQQEQFCALISKLEGLFILTEEEDFFLFRRIIFECLSLLNSLIDNLCQD